MTNRSVPIQVEITTLPRKMPGFTPGIFRKVLILLQARMDVTFVV